jgi:hypothetical protein
MSFKRLGVLAGVGLAAGACTTMKPVTLEQLGAIRPAEVVVTKADQSVIVVSGPQTMGDTLLGYVNGQFEEIPGDHVRTMLVKRPARKKTIALVAVGIAAVAGTAMMISQQGDHVDPAATLDCDDDPDQVGCPNNPNPM